MPLVSNIAIAFPGLAGDEEYQLGLERARRMVAKQDAGQALKNLTISENDQREYQTQCKLVGSGKTA